MATTVDEVLADPQRFFDETVALRGEMDRTISERVIALSSTNADQGMLAVLADQALKRIDSLQAGDQLEIVGVIRPITQEQIRQVEQQLGVDLDEQQMVNLANQAPFIVAQSVTK